MLPAIRRIFLNSATDKDYDSHMSIEDIRADSPRWIGIASIWFGFGLIDGLETVFVMRSEGMHHAWLILFAVVVFSWLPWIVATPLILRLSRKFPLVKPISILTWIVHVFCLRRHGDRLFRMDVLLVLPI